MRPIFSRSRTTFEKIFIILMVLFFIALLIASNVNLDIFVYAGFGTYVIIGLLAFIKPGILFEVLKKEHEDYLVRNQRKIPTIKAVIRLSGFTLTVLGVALTYVFIVIY